METPKFKKINLLVNIPILTVFFISLFSLLYITDRWAVYYIGIASRVLLGIWCIFNGIWNACTDYYSILMVGIYRHNKKIPKWGWWVIFILGIWCIITAFMGYGFNNVEKPI
jgi:hypothetical protein